MTDAHPTTAVVTCVYSTQQVERAAEMLLFESSSKEYPAQLASFVFRHDSGAWWTCCPETRRWHRHVQGQWVPGNPPVGRLLGPAWVGHLELFGQDCGLLDEDEDDDLDAVPEETDPGGGPRVIAMAVADIQDAFAAGRLDSAMAEAALRRLYIMDGQGRAWAVGAQSGEWFVLADRGWLKDPAGPEGVAQVDSPDYAQSVIDAQVPILAGLAPELPESVVSAWDPPEGLPGTVEAEAPPRCVCGETLAEGANFCAKCGAKVSSIATPRKPEPPPPDVPAETAPPSPPVASVPQGVVVAEHVEPSDQSRRPEPAPDRRAPAPRPRRWKLWLWVVCIAAVVIPLGVFLVVWLDDQVFVGAETMYWRGENYRTGEYSIRDPERALYWFKRAADRGHVPAMQALAEMYERGDGVPVDRQRAAQWRDRAGR